MAKVAAVRRNSEVASLRSLLDLDKVGVSKKSIFVEAANGVLPMMRFTHNTDYISNVTDWGFCSYIPVVVDLSPENQFHVGR